MARKKKKQNTSLRGRFWAWCRRWGWALTKVGLSVVFVVVAIVFGYGYYMSGAVEARFGGRKWSVPSRVYSDGLVVYPGQRLSLSQLTGRLKRLGYRSTERVPLAEGEYRIRSRSVTVHFRPIKLQVMKRPPAVVRFDFEGRRSRALRAITDAKSDEVLPIFEIEPEELMQVFGDRHESRQLVALKDVPQPLINAVLAAEDADFYRHFGVDLVAILRAAYVNTKEGGVRQGGSTLTQQLAKSFFLTPERTVWRKLKELIIAVVIEIKYEKDDILEIYLNEVYLGQRGSVSVHGFGEASRFYFGRRIQNLAADQCATLAGIIRSPNRYSPYAHPKTALARRNVVLKAMRSAGSLDEDAYSAAAAAPLGTVPFTPYERVAPYFFDYMAAELEALYPDNGLSRLGMSLYTTLDVGIQAEAERALKEGLAKLEEKHPNLKRAEGKPRLQGAIVVLQPSTGHVLAMVGGRSYGVSQFNRVTQAHRQPGSAFKPFVYLAALEQHSLTHRLSNEAKTYRIDGKRWRPKNYDGQYGGTVSMREALRRSLNVPTVELANDIGLDRVIAMARTFGIQSKLEAQPALALGAFEVVPLELAVAYAGFANEGVLPHPLSLRTLIDEKGKVVQRQHLKIRTVTSPQRAYMMTSALKDVVDRGTARGLKGWGIDYPVAGKTGTTNDYRDAWFVGYTPDLVTLVWVGFDESKSLKLAASRAALPIWADLMRNIGWRNSGRWFEPPAGVTEAIVCPETGLIATSGCPDPKVNEVFEGARVPTDECDEHRSGFREFLDAIGL